LVQLIPIAAFKVLALLFGHILALPFYLLFLGLPSCSFSI